MYTPPRKSRVSSDISQDLNKSDDEQMNTSTPTANYCRYNDELDSSPIALTQESEVCWDWSSPRNQESSPLIRKTLHRKHKFHQKPHLSPLLPLPSRFKIEQQKIKNHTLQEQLDALHRDLLRKKPGKKIEEKEVEQVKEPLDDLFENDDIFVEELVQCSQQVERQYFEEKKQTVVTRSNVDIKFGDDSFDQLIGALDDKVIENLTKVAMVDNNANCSTMVSIQLTPMSEPIIIADDPVKYGGTATISSSLKPNSPVSKCTFEEIERKRREAMAKREKKMLSRPKSSMDLASIDENSTTSRTFERNQSFEFENCTATTTCSPPNFQCTRDEIERKRLVALAKRGKHKLDRSKSNADIDLNELTPSKAIKKNNSFEIPSPSASKSEKHAGWRNIKEWEVIQSEIEKKRQQALARLKRKK